MSDTGDNKKQSTDKLIPYKGCGHHYNERTGEVYRAEGWVPPRTQERGGICPWCKDRGYSPHFRQKNREDN